MGAGRSLSPTLELPYVKVDHSVWFTDGGRPQQIAQQGCADTSGDWRGLATGSSGPLVAWFDCSPASRGDLVVYDTGLRQEVARQIRSVMSHTRFGSVRVRSRRRHR